MPPVQRPGSLYRGLGSAHVVYLSCGGFDILSCGGFLILSAHTWWYKGMICSQRGREYLVLPSHSTVLALLVIAPVCIPP